jgi:hypothetical protein
MGRMAGHEARGVVYMKPIIIIAVALTLSMAHAQQPASKTAPTKALQNTEITKQDFTKLDELRSTRLTVFGARLGQTKDETKAAVEKAGAAWKLVAMATGNPLPGIYDSDGHELALLELSSDGLVTRITLYPGIARYLAGDSAKLFTDDVLDPTSSVRLELLGREDQYEHEPWNNRLMTGEWRRFEYFKEGIEVAGNVPPDPVLSMQIHLFVPAKPRR